MQIPSKAWDKYIARLRKMSDTAARLMLEKLADIDLDALDYNMRRELIEYAYALATKYGEGAGALASEMYDALAELSDASVPAALPADTATYAEVAKAVNGTIKSRNAEIISAAVGRQVKMVGVDTMMQNALRDGAEWAWIPRGDTCAFCIALASRGWQRASKAAIKDGHAEHVHANCDCTYAVRFSHDLDVEGYDPSAYYKMYYRDGKGSSDDKIRALRRRIYAENADEINAQKRQAYALRMHPKAETERQKLEAQARDVYISRGGHDNLTASDASDRFDKLIGAQTDAQLRNYIKKHR